MFELCYGKIDKVIILVWWWLILGFNFMFVVCFIWNLVLCLLNVVEMVVKLRMCLSCGDYVEEVIVFVICFLISNLVLVMGEVFVIFSLIILVWGLFFVSFVNVSFLLKYGFVKLIVLFNFNLKGFCGWFLYRVWWVFMKLILGISWFVFIL